MLNTHKITIMQSANEFLQLLQKNKNVKQIIYYTSYCMILLNF